VDRTSYVETIVCPQCEGAMTCNRTALRVSVKHSTQCDKLYALHKTLTRKAARYG
jgi:hypothetical protein